MAAGGGVEHMGLEHGVVGDARSSMPWLSNTLRSYLRFCPTLRRAAIFQQRFELAQHHGLGQLLPAPQMVVAEGHVGRLPGSMAKETPTTRASI